MAPVSNRRYTGRRAHAASAGRWQRDLPNGRKPAAACDSTHVGVDKTASKADDAEARLEKLEALLADLDNTRELFAAAERRGRTYLAGRGELDQTNRDLSSLLREALEDP